MKTNVVEGNDVCPACGNRLDAKELSDIQGLRRCNTCGVLHVIEGEGDQGSESAFFENDYIHQDNLWFLEEYREDALKRIARVLRKYNRGWRTFLDIGSASGYLFKFFTSDAIETIMAIEPSKFGASRIKDKYPKVHVIQERINDVDLCSQRFDAISILDTIIYHESPRLLLDKLHKALAEDGVLICEVANYRWLNLVGRVKSSDTHWKAYYTRQAIINVLNANGFNVIAQYNNVGSSAPGIKGLFNRIAYFLTFVIYWLSIGKMDFVPKVTIVATK